MSTIDPVITIQNSKIKDRNQTHPKHKKPMNKPENWHELLRSLINSLKDMWKKLPEQVTRIILIVTFFIVVFCFKAGEYSCNWWE